MRGLHDWVTATAIALLPHSPGHSLESDSRSRSVDDDVGKVVQLLKLLNTLVGNGRLACCSGGVIGHVADSDALERGVA